MTSNMQFDWREKWPTSCMPCAVCVSFLLMTVPVTRSSDGFSLGMEDWTDSPSCPPDAMPWESTVLSSGQIPGHEGGASPPSSPPPKSKRLSLFKKTTDRHLPPLDLPAAQHGAFSLSGNASGEHGGESDIHVSALRDVLRCICLLADS